MTQEEGTGRRVTLADVAARAGVSLATASKVMNGRSDVGSGARSVVAEAAETLGYQRRTRRGDGRRAVAVYLRSLDSPYMIGVLEGIEQAARRAGVELLVSSSGDGELDRSWFTRAAAAGAEGIVAVTANIDERHQRWSRSLSLPIVLIDPILRGLDAEGALTVAATNWEGGEAAVRHLLDLGHRRIGILAGPGDSVPAGQRLQGYYSALRQAGIEVEDELVDASGFGYEAGEAGAGRLLDLASPPTAIFGTSDSLAAGALRAARARGLSVPDQLSVIGFDDTMITRWTFPQLTAVRQPLFSMGQVAVERVLALAADPGVFSHPFKLETQLVERESTAAPDGTREDSAAG